MTASDTLSQLDLDKHFAAAQKYFPTSEAYEFGALARTLTSILDESNAPTEIDLLSIDVEGAEVGVLRGVDHTRYTFRYVLVETKDSDQVKRELPGYLEVNQLSHHDFLFAREI